jgi:hypothetical protein
VQVHHDEGVANRIDPESMTAFRRRTSNLNTTFKHAILVPQRRDCQ